MAEEIPLTANAVVDEESWLTEDRQHHGGQGELSEWVLR